MLLLWKVANLVVGFAIFPYSLWFIYVLHHMETNKRLAEEMIRLFTEFKFIMETMMMVSSD